MKTMVLCNTTANLQKQIAAESACPEWQAGKAAFHNREAFDTRHGHSWMLGWLTARLQSETDGKA